MMERKPSFYSTLASWSRTIKNHRAVVIKPPDKGPTDTADNTAAELFVVSAPTTPSIYAHIEERPLGWLG